MNRYQLAKLVEWAETLESRKRMQKVVYMLQAAGCNLQADFYLHHYGPYSDDVAGLNDQMVQSGLLVEQEGQTAFGRAKYSYRLSPSTLQQIRDLEESGEAANFAGDLPKYESLAKRLIGVNLRELEFASTIVFFWKQFHDWTKAVEEATRFKNSNEVAATLPLAKSVIEQPS
ncbi:hypothetical protein [Planctomicrobium sp. SH664]|uniref:hypothetical protein n=1 Tax=Planctomicrobium sp. SH664 TaxID=3448125 RepID=UPI003F5C238D